MSARSAPFPQKKIYMKKEFTFLFSKFLIIGICNSSIIFFLLDIILFLIALPAYLFRVPQVSDHACVAEIFLSKKIYKPLKQVWVDVHHILDFSNIKCFIMQYFIKSCSSS